MSFKNMKINVGGTWKDISFIKMNIGNIWKNVIEIIVTPIILILTRILDMMVLTKKVD